MMKTFSVYDIVHKMIGSVHPVGDSAIDKERFINLVCQSDLLELLFQEIHEVYDQNKDSQEESCRRCAEKAMSDLIDKLCGKIEENMNAQEKKLEKLFGMKAPVSGIFSPVYCRNNTIEERLTDIFATLNNNIMSGMFAWSKLEFIEKKTEGMRKTAAEFASKFLNYYY